MAWPEADRQKGQQLATLLTTSILLQSWDLMQKSYDDVRSSYQPSQALDIALMRLAFVKDVLANPSATSGGHNVQSSSVTSSVSRASMPQTFEAMADLLLYAKEGLLHGHILHDVHLISYAPGHLVCGLGGRAPKNFMKLLKDACERITKQSWDIELRQDTTTPTIIQAKAIEREALKQQALNHPLIKEILHVFPAAKVTIN